MIDRPLRFCMITTFYPPYNFGGDGIFVHQLSNELARRGHHVDVVHCIDAYLLLARKEPSETYQNHPNVTVHGLKSPFGFLSPLATQQTGLPLFKSSQIRQVMKKGFDVIHYHNISLVGGPKILEYGRGIKLYTLHEYWLICPTHLLFRFNRAPCLQRYCLVCALTYRRPPQWWRNFGLLEASVKHVDAFLAPNQFAIEIHHQKGLHLPFVPLPQFVPSMESNTPIIIEEETLRNPFFLFVGRLEKLKGLQTIIPVFRQYCKAQLWIAGTGSYEKKLRQWVDGSPNIRFMGHLSGAKLQNLYQRAVAVIVPSLAFEIFPLVILEAFRQKTLVIVRKLGGMPEIINESGGGFLYEKEEELITAMDQLVANPSYRQELGRRGFEAYQKNWTAEVHLRRYFALIHEIASRPNRRLDPCY